MAHRWLSERPASPERPAEPGGKRTVLVVDLDGELLAPLRAAEVRLCLPVGARRPV